MGAAAALPDAGALPIEQVRLLAPLPQPPTLRDCMAHEKHVKNIAELRGFEIPAVWYQIPVFYFSNTTAIRGPEDPVAVPPGCNLMDLELEVAFVIGREGIDIAPERAFEHVAGFMLMNDWSARDLQMVEMEGRLGPAKGKDFATSLGPWLLTFDEVRDRIDGERISLQATARINGKELTRGNLGDLYHTIPRIIAHVSCGVRLYPGEVIGTGTIGGGCVLEHPDVEFLKPGDVVELEGDGLGMLRNYVTEGPTL
jgi:fumarylacetoacetate (FAA) hydrolase